MSKIRPSRYISNHVIPGGDSSSCSLWDMVFIHGIEWSIGSI